MRSIGKVAVLVLSVVVVLAGCNWGGTAWVRDLDSQEVFSGDQITTKTDRDGQTTIESEFLDVSYSVTMVDESGDPIPDYIIDYTENESRSVLHGYDADGQYAPFVVAGTPDFIESVFAGSAASYSESRSLIFGAIALIVTVGLLGYAEYEFIKKAYRVQQFYFDNAVDYYDGQLLMETTFDEFASDYLAPRVGGVLTLADIGLTFITAGGSAAVGSVYSLTLDVTGQALSTIATGLRTSMVEAAVESWGISMDEALNKTIYVGVDMEEDDNGFEKMYASYRIYESDPRGETIWGDSFETVSNYTNPSSSWWSVVESGTSDIFVTSERASDGWQSAEFNDGSSDDYCYMSGDLDNMQSGWLRWDWCVDQLGSFGFQAWSGSDTYTWDNVNIYLNFGSDGKLYCMYSNSYGLEEAVFSYDPGQWYEMEVYFDCETDTLDLYVNGVKRLRQHDFWHSTSGITDFRFIAFSDASIERAWVDNITATASPAGWSASAVAAEPQTTLVADPDAALTVGRSDD